MAFDVNKKIAFAMSITGDDKVKSAVRGVNEGLWDSEKAASFAQKAFVALLGVGTLAGFAGMVKGSIDAAAGLHDLSIQTGMSVAALAQFRAVGALTSTSAEDVASAATKLAKNLAMTDESGKGAAVALKALGIDFDTFRKLNPDGQMLAVAKAMDQFEDGTDKSAAAMLLFGKEGAKLLPFLGDLADEHDKVVEALTDEEVALRKAQAAMADAFGDNLAKLQHGSAEWKREISMGLTPALYEASTAVVQMVSGTGGLADKARELARDGTLAEWARGAMVAFSYLLDVGQGLFSLLPMLGKLIAGVAAGTSALFGGIAESIQQLASGNLGASWDALKAGFAGVGAVASATGTDIANIWGQKLLGQTFRERMDDLKGTSVEAQKTRRSMDGLADVAERLRRQKEAEAAASKAAEAAQRKLREEYERAVKAGLDLGEAIRRKGIELQRELDMGRKLTAAEKELIDLDEKLRLGTIAMTPEVEQLTRVRIAENAALEANIGWMNDARKANDQARDAISKQTDELSALITKQTEENALLGMSKSALEAHETALLDNKAAAANMRAEMLALVDPEAAQALRDQASAWEELGRLKRENFDKKAALESQNAWLQTIQNIGSGMADALMGGAKSFKSYLVNLFKDTFIRVPLQAVMTGIVGGIGGMLGSAANAMGLGGGGGGGNAVAGGLGDLLQFGGTGIVGGMGALGSFGATGFMSTLTGTGLGTSLGAAGSLIGGGNVLGGIGMGLGAVAPYLLAVAALASLDKKSTPHVGGYAAADASGNVSAITRAMAGQNDFMYQVMQSIRPETQTATESLAGLLAQVLNTAGQTFGGGGSYGVRAGFASDNDDGSRALLELTRDGAMVAGLRRDFDKDPSKGFGEFSAAAAGLARDVLEGLDLPQWASDVLGALGESPALEKLGVAVDQINTMQRALVDMGTAVADLGGPFASIAGLSSDAKKQLADFTGGIEAFLRKTSSYISNYFTEGEQFAITSRRLLDVLGEAGINANAATQRSDLRTLMESLDVSTEIGRKQMAALLNVAEDFASVGDYLQRQGVTLGELAESAPQVKALEALQDPTTLTATAARETAEGVQTVATHTEQTAAAVEDVVEGQDRQTSIMTDGFTRMLTVLDRIATDIHAIKARQDAQAAAA